MRNKLIFLTFLFVVCAIYPAFSQQESITITTYYPAPYGVYQNLRLFPSAEPACDANQLGLLYFDSTSNLLRVCGLDTDNNPVFFDVGQGFWTRNGNNLYANDTNWNVGIGTTTPTSDASPINNLASGNLDVNDIFIRSRNVWAGQIKPHFHYSWSNPTSLLDIKKYIANWGHDTPYSSYCDPGLSITIDVKSGEIIKLTITGSIKGLLYSDIQPTAGTATAEFVSQGSGQPGVSESAIVLGDNGHVEHWVPFSLISLWRATSDGTLTFQQHYFANDFWGNQQGQVAARVMTAEVFNP